MVASLVGSIHSVHSGYGELSAFKVMVRYACVRSLRDHRKPSGTGWKFSLGTISVRCLTISPSSLSPGGISHRADGEQYQSLTAVSLLHVWVSV